MASACLEQYRSAISFERKWRSRTGLNCDLTALARVLIEIVAAEHRTGTIFS
jgi:hypothetical protein